MSANPKNPDVFSYKELHPTEWAELETLLFPFLQEELAELEAADEQLNLDLACWAISLTVRDASKKHLESQGAEDTHFDDDLDEDEELDYQEMVEEGQGYLDMVIDIIGPDNARIAHAVFEHFLVAALNQVKGRA